MSNGTLIRLPMAKIITKIIFGLISIPLLFCCQSKNKLNEEYIVGGDFSIMKKLEDLGGEYKIDGILKKGYQIFKDNGYNYARLRIFHSPDMKGPVCNDLDYTIATAQDAKEFGFQILLNFHYSDTWADPGHQIKPKAWEDIPFSALTDSVYQYTKDVLTKMGNAGVLPEMVQIGNEITPGMLWPEGKIWKENGADWESICSLLKAGIKAVHDVYDNKDVSIMIHTDTGGSQQKTETFFRNILDNGVTFDMIGLSYYPWWHGTLDDLKNSLNYVSAQYDHDIILVETAYYSNGYYPKPDQWIIDYQPYPPTEQGQYDFLVELNSILKTYPKVKGVFYWKPDGMVVEGSEVHYLGRSLFDEKGNAYKGICAWKN